MNSRGLVPCDHCHCPALLNLRLLQTLLLCISWDCLVHLSHLHGIGSHCTVVGGCAHCCWMVGRISRRWSCCCCTGTMCIAPVDPDEHLVQGEDPTPRRQDEQGRVLVGMPAGDCRRGYSNQTLDSQRSPTSSSCSICATCQHHRAPNSTDDARPSTSLDQGGKGWFDHTRLRPDNRSLFRYYASSRGSIQIVKPTAPTFAEGRDCTARANGAGTASSGVSRRRERGRQKWMCTHSPLLEHKR